MKTLINQKQEYANKLIMTSQLRQSIELLQYNTIELKDFLIEKSLENPLLELQESTYDHDSYKGFQNPIDAIAQTMSSPESLTDNLMQQLSFINVSQEIKKLAKFIIHSLDDNGYFQDTIDEVAKIFSITNSNVENALAIVQSFEPIGIGARNLQECLLLQLKQTPKINDLEINMIMDYFDLFVEKKVTQLSKAFNISVSEIQERIDKILLLDPRPGAKFHHGVVEYIVPDIIVNTESDNKIIHLIDTSIPTIQINPTYEAMLKERNSEIHHYLKEKYTEFAWLNRGLAQRKQTILSVMREILNRQPLFFEEGPFALKPLSMKELADSLGVHESTVSRAVRNKYIQTDFGLFEMKVFFSHSAGDQEDKSSAQVKHLIKAILNGEDKKKPLSDQKIVNLLLVQDIRVSRRVVTKYREQLKIPNSSKRKRY